MPRACRANHCGLPWPELRLSFRDEPWTVLLVEPTQCRCRIGRRIVRCEGVTCFDHRGILINVAQTDEQIALTLWHEKPSRLAEIMIETSSNPGDLVVDPMAGSGSTGVAAKKARSSLSAY